VNDDLDLWGGRVAKPGKPLEAVPSGRKSRRSPAPASEQVQARQRILDAAQLLFALQGFDATSTKRIAQEAGVPQGLVFYYFANKEKILEDLVSERSFLPEMERILRMAPQVQPKEALHELGRRFLAVVTRREAIARILVRESPNHPQVAQRWHQMRESAIDIIGNYLKGAVDLGHLHTAQPDTIARIFLYNLIFAALIDEAVDAEQYLGDVVQTMLEGIVE
jgi:AcrR family transcriptional regulator